MRLDEPSEAAAVDQSHHRKVHQLVRQDQRLFVSGSGGSRASIDPRDSRCDSPGRTRARAMRIIKEQRAPRREEGVAPRYRQEQVKALYPRESNAVLDPFKRPILVEDEDESCATFAVRCAGTTLGGDARAVADITPIIAPLAF